MDNLTPKEIADEEMINQAFHELLNDYLSTKHRKKVEIITKSYRDGAQAIKVLNAVRVNLTLCTRLPLQVLYATKSVWARPPSAQPYCTMW